MTDAPVSFSRLTYARVLRVIRAFSASEVGARARALFLVLIALLFAVNGLNVVNSYVGRDFMTALESRDVARFVREAILYVGVFAASSVVGVFYRFSEERLGLLWREWLTRRLVAPGTVLDGRDVAHVLDLLTRSSITYLTIADADDAREQHDVLLELATDGGWTCKASPVPR